MGQHPFVMHAPAIQGLVIVRDAARHGLKLAKWMAKFLAEIIEVGEPVKVRRVGLPVKGVKVDKDMYILSMVYYGMYRDVELNKLNTVIQIWPDIDPFSFISLLSVALMMYAGATTGLVPARARGASKCSMEDNIHYCTFTARDPDEDDEIRIFVAYSVPEKSEMDAEVLVLVLGRYNNDSGHRVMHT